MEEEIVIPWKIILRRPNRCSHCKYYSSADRECDNSRSAYYGTEGAVGSICLDFKLNIEREQDEFLFMKVSKIENELLRKSIFR